MTRIWDLNSKKCLGILQESSSAVFDNTGSVLASNMVVRPKGITESLKNYIHLRDATDITEDPFMSFEIPGLNEKISQLEFSNNGKMLVANSLDQEIYVLDSFEGSVIYKIKKEIEENNFFGRFSISPCSNYIACGMETGELFVWNLETKSDEPFCRLKQHIQPCGIVKFNPKLMILASSCANVILWTSN